MNEALDELEEEAVGKSNITIIGDGYKLVTIPADNIHWNLYFLRKNKKGEDTWLCDYYGLVLRDAIPHIINYKLAQKLNGQAVTLQQYLRLWLKMQKIVTKEVHGL